MENMMLRKWISSTAPALAVLLLGFNLSVSPALAATAPAALPSLAPILEKATAGVVNVSVQGTVKNNKNPMMQDPNFRRFFEDPLFKRFFEVPDQAPEQKIQSVGSGVIFNAKKGYILTNNHVIDHADTIMITLTDRRRLKATVVGTDADADVAVLKVDPKGLTEIPMGDSSNLKVGDFVIAIGNPFGIGQTATLGIVSALGRTGLGIEGYEDFIQTDASINPGNSGGALITQDGRLVGMNTAILSESGGNVGIGFAIPINMIHRVVDQLVEHGKVRRGQLGVYIQDVTPDIADAMQLSSNEGAVVSRVMAGSPAEKSGLKAGDVITAINGSPITSSSQLRNEVGMMKPAAKIRLDVVRDGKKIVVNTALVERTEDKAEATPAPAAPAVEGATFSTIPSDNEFSGKLEGVYVAQVNPGSKAADAGLRAGDIIISANRQAVKTPEELTKIIKAGKDKPILMNIRRGQGALFLVLK
jgi:Do/DeqQ family serine protease